ncbi:kelch-like protein 31 [Punica granatum]|uniref:FKB95-like N-terminal Kelch domain-containing protein n=2 Tax=Punica granatum TaxID=22663 RepID=A0A218WZ53_PUNGR|nr:kelch-like protein 31 [Punica granatum]OWM77511.1 hypothetical protein CDL15_Pgr016909 [Punica granatum]PKI77572.1 hypothetical protein CRG98_002026 [Punica granatum]
MGSLPSLPRPATPPPLTGLDVSSYRVYASFCMREPTSDASISNWIECYDPCGNTWTQVTSIPGIIDQHVLKGFAMVSVGDWLYVIGGQLCRKEMAHVSDELADLVDVKGEVLSSVWCYNVRTDHWSKCAALRMPRSDFACTVCDGKIYVAGGQSPQCSARGISSTEVYDPALDEWTSLPNMNTVRYKCVGVTWQGKIHVVGGFAERLDSDRALPFMVERSSAEVYDPRTGRWELMAKMWQLDVPPNQIVPVEGRLFSSGDCLKAWKGHIEAYDDKLNIWNVVRGSHLRTLSLPIASTSNGHDSENSPQVQQLYLTMAHIRTHLYFLAGYRTQESPKTVSMVHVFDTSATSNGWKSFEPILEDVEKELCSHCCVVQLL